MSDSAATTLTRKSLKNLKKPWVQAGRSPANDPPFAAACPNCFSSLEWPVWSLLLPEMINILPGTLQGWQSNLLLAASAAAPGASNCWIALNISGKALRIHPLGLLQDIRGCSFSKSINLMFSSTVPAGIETYAGHSQGCPFHKGWGENPEDPCGV